MLANQWGKILFTLSILITLAGCATLDLPTRYGTITESQASMRKDFKPSKTGAAVGAVAGGVAGNQIGKGNGKKIATAIGALGGAVVGAAAGGTEEMVPTSIITFRDDVTGEVFKQMIDGNWKVGMKVRFFVTAKNEAVIY